MRRTFLFILLISLIASCQWSPERDNPFDPNSVGYVAPPPLNTAPVIDTFYATTQYWDYGIGGIFEFELVCTFSDIDNNIPPELPLQFPIYYQDDHLLGYLKSDPKRLVYSYRGYKDDLDRNGTSHKFTVHVTDDSGATVTENTFLGANWPSQVTTLINPPPQTADPVDLSGSEPRIVWEPPVSGYSHFGLSLYLRGIFDVWDTVGISINDTVAYVPREVVEDAGTHPESWYAIYVTLFDNEGNSGTSRPGFFYFYESSTQHSDPFREENYGN